MELTAPNEFAALLLAFRLAAARLARSAIATLKTALSALRRSRKKPTTLTSFVSLPFTARILLIFPIFLLPLLLYTLLSAVSSFSTPSSSASSFPSATSSSLLSVTARIANAAPSAASSYSAAASYASSFFALPHTFAAAPRRVAQTVVGAAPSLPSQDPTIRLVFACDRFDPCCDATYTHSFRAALRQTLIPNDITFLHGCTSSSSSAPATGAADAAERAERLEASARGVVAAAVGDTVYDRSVRNSESFVRFVACAPPSNSTEDADAEKDRTVDMEECLLRFLVTHQRKPAAKPNSYVLVASTATVLEPTAAESLWLYLFTRPTLRAVRPLGYHEPSLRRAVVTGDPLQANVSLPDPNPTNETPVPALPLLATSAAFTKGVSNAATASASQLWGVLVHVMATARIARIPLYTFVDQKTDPQSQHQSNSHSSGSNGVPTLALNRQVLPKHKLPAHLWSEHAFYRYSARQDVRETYALPLESDDDKRAFDFWGMPFREVHTPIVNSADDDDDAASENDKLEKRKPRVFFVMPWIQMGGSEKCMLDVAERLVQLKWPVTFVLTMPFWHEDPLGELALKHEWIDKALAITPDVFDLVALAPNDKFSKVLRYMLESRSPDYILTGNSRVVYEHVKFIKRVLPKVVIADYNHMVHMTWEVVPGKGGGMPRYAAEFTDNIDLHLTASDNVTRSIKSWMPADAVAKAPEKVKTCYIGTDPSALHSEQARSVARAQMRRELGIPEDKIVVLFAGRFVADKGIDTMSLVVKAAADDRRMAERISFVFVGSGEQKGLLETTLSSLKNSRPQMIIRPPAVGLAELRNYYAMGDIFLLPSNNEGIALVLYEAMASGMLVMGTDVGGQKELIRTNTGVLLPNLNNPSASSSFIVRQLQAYTKFTGMFREIQDFGRNEVRTKFTTEKFCDCVIDNMQRAHQDLTAKSTKQVAKATQEKAIEATRMDMAEVMRGERVHGMWNQRQVDRTVESQVTVGIKTFVCDSSIVRQVVGLVRSIRVNYPKVRIILANDGPTPVGTVPLMKADKYTEEVMLPADSGISIGRNVMVNMTQTEFFVLLDDDHVFDEDTDLGVAIHGIANHNFDVVGIRVRNLPGIEELERISIFIPRYVAKVSKFENREVTLCVWNENNGPGVQSMRVPIRVDVLHNALIARTDTLRAHPWRNILKVNEHMTFFLDLRRAGVHVGYLPSVFVHHRARRYSACYKTVRFREDKYEQLLDYKDSYLWDVPCGDDFPNVVKKHIDDTKSVE